MIPVQRAGGKSCGSDLAWLAAAYATDEEAAHHLQLPSDPAINRKLSQSGTHLRRCKHRCCGPVAAAECRSTEKQLRKNKKGGACAPPLLRSRILRSRA